LDEKTFKEECVKISLKISAMLDSFRNNPKIVQNDLRPGFKRSLNKSANCKQRSYTIKEFEHY
jgi:hypothetical protein